MSRREFRKCIFRAKDDDDDDDDAENVELVQNDVLALTSYIKFDSFIAHYKIFIIKMYPSKRMFNQIMDY